LIRLKHGTSVLEFMPRRSIAGICSIGWFAGVALGACNAAWAQSRDRPMYELTFEDSTVAADQLTARRGKKAYAVAKEGAGREPGVVFDPTLNSRVLDFEVSATAANQVKDRSELTIYSGVDFGKTWWVSMKVMVPQGNVVAKNWHSFVQCPQAGMPASPPPFSISMAAPNRLMLVSRSDEDSYKEFASGDLPVGKWVNLVLELKMGETGYAGLWLDGQPLGSGEVPLRWKAGEPRCTLKVGIYRGKAQTPFTMRVDDIRIGSTRDAVAGR
jgi:hypothetical protein